MKNLITKCLFIIVLTLPAFFEMNGQAIGIQMGSMRKMMPEGMPAVIAKLKELGITEIEGDGGRSMDKAAFRKLVEDNGLKIIATGSGDFKNLENKDSIQKIISNAKALGAQYVVCYWIPHEGDNFTYANMQKAVEVFNSAGKTLKENGLSFCYHPHGYEFREYAEGKGTLFEYMMDKTDPQYVNFQMDVFWIKNPGQDPVALLKKYPTRWKMLHLKDRRIGTPNNLNGRQDKETNVVLGTGDVGIAEVMKAAKQIGIKHYFIEDESSRALEQVPQHVAFLKSLK
jgi:sugar phosphate isomerase/epimerase